MYTKKELMLLCRLSRGDDTVAKLSDALGISSAQVYNLVGALRSRGILDRGPGIRVSTNVHAKRLLNILNSSEYAAIALADSGLDVLMEMRSPVTMKQLLSRSDMSRATVFRHVDIARRCSMVRKDGDIYRINDTVWQDLRGLLNSVEEYRMFNDPRVPRDSRIYRNTAKEVLYSSDTPTRDRPAAFSLFRDYGINAISPDRYLTTSDKEMNATIVFNDAFCIAEAEKDYRMRLALMAFYLHNRDDIVPDDRFVEIFERIESGESVEMWPSIGYVNEKMEDFL